MISWTPTEHRLMEKLSDGLPHTKRELKGCIDFDPDLVETGALKNHVSNIRKKLAPQGFTVVCVVWERKHCYQLYRPVSAITLRGSVFGVV